MEHLSEAHQPQAQPAQTQSVEVPLYVNRPLVTDADIERALMQEHVV
jgi:hypothetical protein